MKVVIVESPAKAKTINKYLGSGFQVLASYGHVRDLPAKDGSVDPEADFRMTWEVDPKAQKRLNEIAEAVKGAAKLILATDPDREGEAISWHVLEILQKKKALSGVDVERVAFNAITKDAVHEALRHPRAIDQELVDAYLARRALDYLVGFTLSPVLWRKLPGARSAGRVQSVALRLICERELEIEAFRSQEYWSLEGVFAAGGGRMTARLSRYRGQKAEKFTLTDEAAAKAAEQAARAASYRIGAVESKPAKRHPAPPFTTSTLQQEASRKLGFSASHTMQVAQRLYEGVDTGGETVGLITYMRTDGVSLAPEAVGQIRRFVETRYREALPDVPRAYKSKQKNAQEAHEGIRPTDVFRTPEQVAGKLDRDQARLYELIWKRAVASQMESAQLERTTIDIEATDGQIAFRATGSVVLARGFLALYREDRDDSDSAAPAAPESEDEDGVLLPKVAAGDGARAESFATAQHFTEPPPRYTEASLVKRMEELGIGRPSTYASIIATLSGKNYVRLEQKRFIPEDRGRLVTAFLTSFFSRYVQYDFTADLEGKLDRVSAGEMSWKELLREFWRDFSRHVEGVGGLRVTDVLDSLNDVLGPHIFPVTADGADPRKCPSCADGRLSLKVGKFGAFVGCSNYPECRFTRKLGQPAEGETLQTRVLGEDPQTGLQVAIRDGRFGPYLQLGEGGDGEKPKRASLPKGLTPADVDLPLALRLLSVPREVGQHPETGKPIVANFGRFGPYVSHDGQYANLETWEDVFTVGINRAVTLLAEKKAKGFRARNEPKALKELGAHPDGGPVRVLEGRYGAYVKHGDVNATLPKGVAAADVTMEEALRLLAERAARGGGRSKAKPKPAKRAAKPKAAAPKAEGKKKPPAKAKAKARAAG